MYFLLRDDIIDTFEFRSEYREGDDLLFMHYRSLHSKKKLKPERLTLFVGYVMNFMLSLQYGVKGKTRSYVLLNLTLQDDKL